MDYRKRQRFLISRRQSRSSQSVKNMAWRNGKWKEYIATIDTGCSSGNRVPVQILTELGITEDLLPLTKEEEERGSQSASGEEVYARGAVELTWRGDPEEFPNSSKTFKNMHFLVSAVQNPAYDILISKKSICEHKILFALTILGGRKIVELPPPASLPRGLPTYQRQTLAERQRINNLALAAQNMNNSSTLSNTEV
ncbi:hypothetical protein B0O99DRAFT_60848 [Bisporella sp. PMI_857]|nr:hypothetical protein B0O99DRAFT_60848 [Bisporella sp. PMI_857]